jgi:hypothetical protein
MFKVSPASLQTFIDTPNFLEDRVQYSTVRVQYSTVRFANLLCDSHHQIINVFAQQSSGAHTLFYHPVLFMFPVWHAVAQ